MIFWIKHFRLISKANDKSKTMIENDLFYLQKILHFMCIFKSIIYLKLCKTNIHFSISLLIELLYCELNNLTLGLLYVRFNYFSQISFCQLINEWRLQKKSYSSCEYIKSFYSFFSQILQRLSYCTLSLILRIIFQMIF